MHVLMPECSAWQHHKVQLTAAVHIQWAVAAVSFLLPMMICVSMRVCCDESLLDQCMAPIAQQSSTAVSSGMLLYNSNVLSQHTTLVCNDETAQSGFAVGLCQSKLRLSRGCGGLAAAAIAVSATWWHTYHVFEYFCSC
jgi:hypothetical protein